MNDVKTEGILNYSMSDLTDEGIASWTLDRPS
jgi:hypothetical protein